MGLEKFMDGFDEEAIEEENNSTGEPDYTYNGDKELLEIEIDDVQEVLDEVELSFKDSNLRIKGATRYVESEKGTFVMVVSCPYECQEPDCIKVHVLENESLYDVIEPYAIYKVEGWKGELKEAIRAVQENSDDIVNCPRCESVMIIRTTNGTNERIRGCSNYPDCRYSEKP